MSAATLTRSYLPLDANWRLLGTCRYVDPDVMHPQDRDLYGQRQAKAVCKGCPVKDTCLTDAIETGDWNGIRGGMTGKERRALVASGPTAPPMGCGTCGRLRRNHTTRDHAWQSPSMEAVRTRVAHARQEATA